MNNLCIILSCPHKWTIFFSQTVFHPFERGLQVLKNPKSLIWDYKNFQRYVLWFCMKAKWIVILLNQNLLELIRKNDLQSILFIINIFLFLITRILLKNIYSLYIIYGNNAFCSLYVIINFFWYTALCGILWGGVDDISIGRRWIYDIGMVEGAGGKEIMLILLSVDIYHKILKKVQRL